MFDLILDALGGWEYRQYRRIEGLSQRLDSLSSGTGRSHAAAFEAERNLAAIIRVLLKKGLVTQEELVAEFAVIDAALIAKIGTFPVETPAAGQGKEFDAEQIAKLDTAAVDTAAEIKLDLK
jgi:hypothetical protein